jgi:Secretion system C-terminal sorting domain/Divergent InlB B-repeat domain/Viral BACON domain
LYPKIIAEDVFIGTVTKGVLKSNFSKIPPVPSVISPPNGYITNLTNIDFVWDTSAFSSYYHIQVSTSSTFNNITYEQNEIIGSNEIIPLNSGENYFWRIRSVNAFGHSNWSGTMSFTVQEFQRNLNITPLEIFVSNNTGSATFNVEANADWVLTDDADWLNKSLNEGSGNETIQVNYLHNSDSTTRIATLTWTSGDIIKNATVTQAGTKYYNISAVVNPVESGVIVGTGVYSENSDVSLVCTPNDGWNFEGWYDNYDDDFFINDTSFAINVTQNRSFVAQLTMDPTSIFNDDYNSPVKFDLQTNFPNPFNPTTNIRFSIPHAANVKIQIFDMLGEEVEVLTNQYFNSGTYLITFHSQNIPSGIYYYRIQSEGFCDTKKMILLK